MSDRPIIIIKKKSGHGGHHGGSWKVAFADFMTAMMALFLVLWLVAQNPQVANSVGEYFRNPEYYDTLKDGVMPGSTGFNPMRSKTGFVDSGMNNGSARQRLEIAARKMREGMQGFGALRDQVTISITPDGLLIQLVESDDQPLFQSGSAAPTQTSREIILEISREIARLPNRIVVSGHTDRKALNKKSYSNWELSADRANTARRILVEGGVSNAQIGRVAGYADTQPLDPADPYAPINRRITILVTPEEVDTGSTFFDVFPAGEAPGPPQKAAPKPEPQPKIEAAHE